jgi:hypothetical protein
MPPCSLVFAGRQPGREDVQVGDPSGEHEAVVFALHLCRVAGAEPVQGGQERLSVVKSFGPSAGGRILAPG